jgi:hypothetical protein
MRDILIMLNNNFHDVASGLLLSSAVILGALNKSAERGGDAEKAALARAYPVLTKFAWGSVAWIVLGGIPRTIFFKRFERDPAVRSSWVSALIVKHVLLSAAVVIGALWWRRLALQARQALASKR